MQFDRVDLTNLIHVKNIRSKNVIHSEKYSK